MEKGGGTMAPPYIDPTELESSVSAQPIPGRNYFSPPVRQSFINIFEIAPSVRLVGPIIQSAIIQNIKTDFSFDSALCASFMKIGTISRGVCISLVGNQTKRGYRLLDADNFDHFAFYIIRDRINCN